MQPLRIAILGFGKIAADQHVPSIEANSRLELVATSSRSGHGPAPRFTDWRELLDQVDGLEAVAITTPPSARFEIARACIERGLHVLLEKPPTATLSEIEELACVAETRKVTLFTTWHAQHNPAVTVAAEALAGKRIAAMDILWHEDVRKWHPGQRWIWEPGGFGVFDPGINAFSIATKIFPGTLLVRKAELYFPEDAQTPIAAEIEFASSAADGPLTCSLDWRRSEGEEWTIVARTADGVDLRLEDGGSRLSINGQEQAAPGPGEYPDIYRQFVELIDERRSHVDVVPLRLVADCLLAGRRHTVGAAPA
jgi:D-galactose 1-dehydrogenase